MSDVDRWVDTTGEPRDDDGSISSWPVPRPTGGDWLDAFRARLGALFEREMEAGRGFLWLPVVFGAGILVYFALPAEPSLLALAVAAVAATGFALRVRRRVAAFRVAVALAMLAAGLAAMKLRTEVVAAPVLAREMTVDVTGWVAEREAAARGGTRVRLRVVAIDGVAAERTPRAVRITIRSRADDIRVGDALSVLARLRPPSGPMMPGGYDFGRADFYEGIGAVGFAYGAAREADIGKPPWPIALSKPLADLREAIRQRIIGALPGDTGEIAAALVMGDQRGISEKTQEAMRDSGLGHVLSISGLHMALVAGSVFWFIRALLALSPALALTRPIKKWAAAGALAVATFYLTISGGNVATQRAWVMLAVILFAVMIDRRAITLRNVAIAALIVLIVEPESLLTASFQMSFAATLALVAGYEAIRQRADRRLGLATLADRGLAGRLWFSAHGLFLTSLIAALATTPFAIYHFQRAAPLALLANLAAMPVVGILVMPAALFAVLLMPFGLEHLALVPMGWGIDWVVLVGEMVAGWSEGWGGIRAVPAAALLLVVAGFLWLALWRERWRLLGLVPMLAAIPVALAAPQPDILIDAGGRVVAVRGGDGRYAVVNPKSNRFAAEYWLRADADPRQIEDGVSEGVACDGLGCVARLADGTRVAVGSAPGAFADDCRLAEVVVSRFRAPPWCHDAAVVIDRNALARGGAHALYRIPAGDGAEPGFRIETAFPEGVRRPFMPPLPSARVQ
ncbi:MAG TPA: ComEC/Rec2 family competence protein [Bauldia sp.]|nr:ComEC/Rec2 family competence protein [Bauldia sp.]